MARIISQSTLVGLFATFMLVPASAAAWDFTCSPANRTEIEPTAPPKIMTMLDRSGSMKHGDRVRTCRVCEDPDGDMFEVTSAADCVPTGTSWAVSQNQSIPQNSAVNGYAYNYTLTGFPAPDFNPTLTVTLYGDFGSSCEYAEVFADGRYLGRMDGGRECNGEFSSSWELNPSEYMDGVVNVFILTTPDGNSCSSDGVDAYCGSNYSAVTIEQRSAKYLGSQQLEDPCGKENKWEQAVSALERVTYESSSQDPDIAEFGLALYHDDKARIEVECAMDSHGDIMSVLTSEKPDGSTPTARAIWTSANSDCVGSSAFEYAILEDSEPKDVTKEGYDFNFDFTGLPSQGEDFELTLGLQGDYNGSCELADLYVDGDYIGRFAPNSDLCSGSLSERTFVIPASYLDDGELKVVVHNRDSTEVTATPSCSFGANGVHAYCDENRGVVTLRLRPRVTRSAATILVNDGEPTKSFGGRDPYHASVYEACQHRDVAQLFVVGLGSGTDEDFNNIVAAAGGSGECLVSGSLVDPCDDPGNWASLRNRCTGSFQTDSSESLLAALAAITASMQCVFDVNFSNSGVGAVPDDPNSDFPYLYVSGAGLGFGDSRIYNKDSVSSSPPGEGWEFVSSTTRRRVQFTDHFCDLVQRRRITEATTQLACLCQEAAGDRCNVPNADALNLCPQGNWACTEGIDICVPDANCCVPDLPCDTGLQGVCAEGITECVGATEICRQVNNPSGEVCNGLDDDCDGLVDNIPPTPCTVPGAFGRCAPGVETCDPTTFATVCSSLFDPMPELCNGLDDDCDSNVDNISESWSKPEFRSGYPLQDQELACNFNNVCGCDGAMDDHAGGDFDEFVASWDPVCICGEGLAAPEMTEAPEASTSEPKAGCAAAGTDNADGVAILALLGFLGLRRRRE